MDKRQLQACIDYINKNVAALHGVPGGKVDVGPDATIEMVKQASIQGSNAVIVLDRGIKGTPKYIIPVADLEKGEPLEEEKPKRGR